MIPTCIFNRILDFLPHDDLLYVEQRLRYITERDLEPSDYRIDSEYGYVEYELIPEDSFGPDYADREDMLYNMDVCLQEEGKNFIRRTLQRKKISKITVSGGWWDHELESEDICQAIYNYLAIETVPEPGKKYYISPFVFDPTHVPTMRHDGKLVYHRRPTVSQLSSMVFISV